MRLTSLAQASEQAHAAFMRFPLALSSAFFAASLALSLIPDSGEHPNLIRALLAVTLGLPLGVALDCSNERRHALPARRWMVRCLGLVVLLVFFFLSRGWTTQRLTIHYIQVSLVLHLLVSVLPFKGGGRETGFWQFNRILFQRFLVAAFYAGVLFAALAVALTAIDRLLGIEVANESYARLWVMLAFIFQPWFFLGGLPDDLDALESRDDYPSAMKVFAQFILIPVVTVYMMILTAYLGRVLVTRIWPSGWIGYLVTSVAVAGTLALLLVHPIRERSDSRWINAYGRWFYAALLPSIGMLLLAVYQRVHQYGLTENRYFLAVIAFWLAGIALYYSWRGSRSIRLIPMTLGLVALATLAGPWSATALARRSQSDRLQALLIRNHLLVDDRVQHAPQPPAVEEQRQIRDTLRYLIDTHGATSLARVSESLHIAAVAAPADSTYLAAVAVLGLQEAEAKGSLRFDAAVDGAPRHVAGYDYLVSTDLVQSRAIQIEADSLHFTFSPSPPTVHVARSGETLLEVDLGPLIESANMVPHDAKFPRPVSRLRPLELDAQGDGIRLRILLIELVGNRTPEGFQLERAMADVLIGFDRRTP